MRSTQFEVPTVDLAPYVRGGTTADKAEVARALDEACRTVGFIQIVGHDVPETAIHGLRDALDDFFALTLEDKKKYVRPVAENRGYSPPKSESLSYSLGVDSVTRMNDFFEAFNVGTSSAEYPDAGVSAEDYPESVWPQELTAFRPQVETYFSEARRVARTLTEAFADALGVEHERLASLMDHSLDVMRMNNYALPPGEIELEGELTGMGEHTDFGLVTVLWADQVAGLQVLGADGGWHDVSPTDGALLVNLGDVAARLTNDVWMSTLHRVKPPVIDGVIKRRRSVAFFHDGNADAIIETIPSFVPAGEEALYEPVSVKDHVEAKLNGSRAGQKNTRATREAARVIAAADS
ncbi:conserved hypothetical protein [metagenome]|uniref:Fe2OG dioxygenase domain-containing protein n=1 Tax=metagenome TaxID=256318 RepID=A0A2P2C4A6_9ZZZZ